MIRLFDSHTSIDICLKNSNPYVALAAEDLRNDFARVNASGIKPSIIRTESECCIVIEENTMDDGLAIEDESYSIRTEGNVIRISAASYLGSMWGIYTFSSNILGVDPCYLFNDMVLPQYPSLETEDIAISLKPAVSGFRGVFINDEDLLTGWLEGGGLRLINYPWYGTTVAPRAMEMVVETVLRLRMNLIIPASFLDIDNPPEKLLADTAAMRGLFLSQHHVEPLGLSHFSLENYCRKYGKSGEYSYIRNPELLDEAWRYYAAKWAEYDHVVWQLGLRGKADRPMWEEKKPGEEDLQKYGAFISGAMQHQKEIVLQATDGRAHYFTSTLWMEGAQLMEKGYLSTDNSVIHVFADTGTNQMYGAEYYRIPRSEHHRYGIYYHLQYHHEGPHLAPQTGLDKLYFNIRTSFARGDHAYYIINISNVREFVFELDACAQMLWDIRDFSKNSYMSRYCSAFGEYAVQMQEIISDYYRYLPELDIAYLKKDLPKYFNYDYEKRSSDIKNFVLKEGNILTHGREIISSFRSKLRDNLYPEYAAELETAIPRYEDIHRRLTDICAVVSENVRHHITCKWMLYTNMLLNVYRWYVYLYAAKRYYDQADCANMISALKNACTCLEEHLHFRTCAEDGIFQHWFRGDTKMNIKQCLFETCKLLGQTPDF